MGNKSYVDLLNKIYAGETLCKCPLCGDFYTIPMGVKPTEDCGCRSNGNAVIVQCDSKVRSIQKMLRSRKDKDDTAVKRLEEFNKQNAYYRNIVRGKKNEQIIPEYDEAWRNVLSTIIVATPADAYNAWLDRYKLDIMIYKRRGIAD